MNTERPAILDISGDTLTLVAQQDDRLTGKETYSQSKIYSGYVNGEFCDVKNLFASISNLIEDCREKGFELTRIKVGIPGEFTTAFVTNEVKNFGDTLHKVTQEDVDELLNAKKSFKGTGYDYAVLSADLISLCGNDGKKTCEPSEIMATELTASISYVLCKQDVISLLNQCAKELTVLFDYTSTVRTEAMTLIPAEERSNGAIFIDSGFISTTMTYVKDNSILRMQSFSKGTAHVASDLCTCLNNCRGGISFSEGKELVNKINLNLNPGPSDVYSVALDDKNNNYRIAEVNAISSARIIDLASQMARILASWPADMILPSAPIFMTGAGLINITGASSIIQEITQREVKTLTPTCNEYSKPKFASIASLVLSQQQIGNASKGFMVRFKEFFNKFNRRNK